MKKMIILVLLVTGINYAEASAVPVCNEDATIVPCVLKNKDATLAVMDMMFNNRKGFDEISSQAKLGFTLSTNSFQFNVTLLEYTAGAHPTSKTTSKIKYEILLDDCRGTDACLGSYLWTVIETNTGDGYTSGSTFSNTLTKATRLPN